MAFTSNIKFYIGITDNGIIEIRRTKEVFEDGESIGERNFRYTLEPGQDLVGQPQKVQRIANAVWTPQVIADYQAAKAAQGR